ncbi:S1-C subfamily serine protease [Pseudonocardia parietis]|uniref:S1-C subfamily serine protease n=1 Tax=Pseudonocardia parietis TaxID=570936 RepID=A0ABS4VM61_9PSEU|nr:MarP family serine protease [Pseudonocardia parietis]MBP2365016.1 S1-C subfamily serine protease [Pseudonocardia parietis]
MSISWVDVVVVILALLAAASGWRHGVAVALLSFLGVLTGAVLGLRVAPLLAGQVESQQAKVLLGIGAVVLLVALGEATGVYLGRFIRDRIRREGTLKVDSTLGAGVQAVAVVVAAWLIALPLASTSFATLTSGLRDSQVLAAVDGVMPDAARELPAELRQILDDSGFPNVVSPFSRTPVAAVGPPDSNLAQDPVVTEVRDRVLKVRGRAPSCRRALEGTAFVVAPQRVMTNAHVVAGTSSTTVEVTTASGRTRRLDAEVIHYDPQVDVAVLDVPELEEEPLRFTPDPARVGDDVIIVGYPLDGPYTVTPGKVRERIRLRGPDIYEQGSVVRDVYTVRAVVRSGNSGGPMITPDGRVVGVVFGAALDDSETGFVLTAEQVAHALNVAVGSGSTPVDTGECAS